MPRGRTRDAPRRRRHRPGRRSAPGSRPVAAAAATLAPLPPAERVIEAAASVPRTGTLARRTTTSSTRSPTTHSTATLYHAANGFNGGVADDERVAAAVLRAERLLDVAGAADDAARASPRRSPRPPARRRPRPRAAVRPHRRGAAHARPATLDGPAPRPRRRRAPARRCRHPTVRRCASPRWRRLPHPGRSRRSSGGASAPRRAASSSPPPTLRSDSHVHDRRPGRVRRQRQPARRGHPRRRRGRGTARRAVRSDAPARRRLRLGEDLGAVRQPRRARLRARGGSASRLAWRPSTTSPPASRPPVFVNLDMEEYRDLHLTVAAFRARARRTPVRRRCRRGSSSRRTCPTPTTSSTICWRGSPRAIAPAARR